MSTHTHKGQEHQGKRKKTKRKHKKNKKNKKKDLLRLIAAEFTKLTHALRDADDTDGTDSEDESDADDDRDDLGAEAVQQAIDTNTNQGGGPKMFRKLLAKAKKANPEYANGIDKALLMFKCNSPGPAKAQLRALVSTT